MATSPILSFAPMGPQGNREQEGLSLPAWQEKAEGPVHPPESAQICYPAAIMRGFLIRLLVSALSLWVASALVPGMSLSGLGTFLLAAFLLGLVNAVIRPVAILLTLPFTLLSLGLFLLVVNAAMLALVAALLPGFALSGFWAALFGSLLVSLVGTVLSWTVGAKGRYEILAVRKRN